MENALFVAEEDIKRKTVLRVAPEEEVAVEVEVAAEAGIETDLLEEEEEALLDIVAVDLAAPAVVIVTADAEAIQVITH